MSFQNGWPVLHFAVYYWSTHMKQNTDSLISALQAHLEWQNILLCPSRSTPVSEIHSLMSNCYLPQTHSKKFIEFIFQSDCPTQEQMCEPSQSLLHAFKEMWSDTHIYAHTRARAHTRTLHRCKNSSFTVNVQNVVYWRRNVLVKKACCSRTLLIIDWKSLVLVNKGLTKPCVLFIGESTIL